MARNEYRHFNPAKFNLQVKVSKVRSSSYCKHNINYHFIWIPKYRKKLLVEPIVRVLRNIILGQCQELKVEPLALEIMPDHIHLFVSATPTHVPFEIIQKIKGNTSRQLRLVFPQLRRLGYPTREYENLWAIGYYVGSAGHVSQDSVMRYILEQQGKDVFEFSVYGDSNKQSTIGDFTR